MPHGNQKQNRLFSMAAAFCGLCGGADAHGGLLLARSRLPDIQMAGIDGLGCPGPVAGAGVSDDYRRPVPAPADDVESGADPLHPPDGTGLFLLVRGLRAVRPFPGRPGGTAAAVPHRPLPSVVSALFVRCVSGAALFAEDRHGGAAGQAASGCELCRGTLQKLQLFPLMLFMVAQTYWKLVFKILVV